MWRAACPSVRTAQASRHVAGCESCAESVADMESAREQTFQAEAVTQRRPSSRWFLFSVRNHRGGNTCCDPVPPAGSCTGKCSLSNCSEGRRPIDRTRFSGAVARTLHCGLLEEQVLVRETLQHRALPAAPPIPVEAPGVLLTPGADAASFTLVGPGDAPVLPDRPVFSWTPLPGATAYQVVVTNEALDPLARSGRVSVTQWQPEKPLPRGVTLLLAGAGLAWQ